MTKLKTALVIAALGLAVAGCKQEASNGESSQGTTSGPGEPRATGTVGAARGADGQPGLGAGGGRGGMGGASRSGGQGGAGGRGGDSD